MKSKRKVIKTRKSRKNFKKKYTRKYKGGDFNDAQQNELIKLLKEKGLKVKQIKKVMSNLNPISQQFTNKGWYDQLKHEISNLNPDNIETWATYMNTAYIVDVETDTESI